MADKSVLSEIVGSTKATLPPSRSSPLIGRQHELTVIMNRYEVAKHGSAQVVLLAGEPGIGKTRLLDEIAALTAQDRVVVLRGEASEAEGMPPYLPFLEALGRYIRDAPLDSLREQVATLSSVLASLFPELVARLGDFAVPYALPLDQARFRLYEAIGDFLEAISLANGLVLLFDDLHWVDTASLDLLCHLARRRSNAHLLFVGAYRDSELGQDGGLSRTIAELSRQRMLTTIVVKPLSKNEIEALAISSLGSTLNPEVSSLLYKQSEGNPFFAEELLRSWVEMGAIIQQHDHWIADASLEQGLPPNLVGALWQRFARLSTESIDDLRVAAIIGRIFDSSLLAAVLGKEIDGVEERLLEAARARLVQANQQGGFIFSHEKIRECLYTEVSMSRRRRLHGRIGHILEERYEQTEATPDVYQLAELAFHFVRSDDRERGIDYSLRAAAQAQHSFATEEALAHYRTALELLKVDDDRRGELLLNLGEAALMSGREAEAERMYESAQHWFAQRENLEAVARAAYGLGQALWREDKRAEARAAFEQALMLFGERCSAQAVEVLADIAVLLTVYLGRLDEGMTYAQRALVMAQELGNADLEARTQRLVAGTLAALRAEDLRSATQFIEQVLPHTEAKGALAEAAECCFNLAVAYYWMSEITRSHAAIEQRIVLAERSRQPHHLRTAYTWQVLLFASQGAWTEAEQVIARAYAIVENLADPVPSAFLHQFCGFLAYQREDYLIAERELQTAQVDQSLQSGLGDVMFYVGLLGLVQASMGKEEEARASVVHVEAHLAPLPIGILPTAPLLICLALTALTLHDEKRARYLYSHLLTFQGQHYWFLVDRVLGMLALQERRWDAAACHLAAAEATARRENLRPELARTLTAQADFEEARAGQGSARRTRELLSQALDLFNELNMSDSAKAVHYKLRALSHRVRKPLTPPLPAGLTSRETTVLKLVTEGMSNSQIAQALGLSEKTVTNHLTHIFNKITCDNRAAATAFAIRHGLA